MSIAQEPSLKDRKTLFKLLLPYTYLCQMIAMLDRMHICNSFGSACGADVLAGRKTVGTISGKVAFGGQGASRGFLRRYTGYVEQNGASGSSDLRARHQC